MFLQASFYDRLDSSYRDELLKLEKEIEATRSMQGDEQKKQINKLLDGFSCKFLMPKNLWDFKIEIAMGLRDFDKTRLATECIFHLSYLNMPNREFLNVPYLYDNKLYLNEERTIPWQPRRKISFNSFCFPHKDLKKKWKEYERNALTFIPRTDRQRYEDIKTLYAKIKSIDSCNIEEWFEALAEVEDVEFFEQNVEYRIGQDLTNKALWKLYIGFLHKNNQKKLLETYAKFCRFFIDDFEMFKEYQKAAEKFGPSKVPWKNNFDFEIYDKSVLCVFKTPKKRAPFTVSKCTSYFDVRNALPQKFPFRPNLMEYIIKNAKAEILFDLFKCCKWFFARYPIPICYKFSANEPLKSIEELAITVTNPNHLKFDKNIFVSSVFSFVTYDQLGTKSLSKFIPKMYRCTAKYVSVRGQNLSMNELKFLIGHGNVLELNLSNIKDQDGNRFAFEDILQFVPKIQVLNLYDVKYPENLSQYLCDLQFQNQIEKFLLCGMQILPEPFGFAEFMLKNTSTFFSSSFILQGLKNGNDFGDLIGEVENDENGPVAPEKRMLRFERIIIEIFTLQRKRYVKPEIKVFN